MFSIKTTNFSLTTLIVLFSIIHLSHGLLRRCYQCRSRGELGSCRDAFRYNVTEVENEPGVAAIPCASGWCGKVIEGGGTYSVDDFDQAIQRMCVQRGPDDNQDRCAHTVYNYKKVYMCFCQGDLCNSSTRIVELRQVVPSAVAVFLVGFVIRKLAY